MWDIDYLSEYLGSPQFHFLYSKRGIPCRIKRSMVWGHLTCYAKICSQWLVTSSRPYHCFPFNSCSSEAKLAEATATTHDEDLVNPEESVPSPLNHIYAPYIFCNTITTRGISTPDIYTAEMTSWLCSSCGVPVFLNTNLYKFLWLTTVTLISNNCIIVSL